MTDISDPRRFLKALSNMGVEQYVSGRKKSRSGMKDLEAAVKSCAGCGLSRTRRSAVFGEGNERAKLVFVGEAPGEEEDRQGRPFVGRAGKLLDRLIERIGLDREDVFICNVLKCRPPHNRDPEPQEVQACRDYLLAQLELIRPKVICTLGKHAYNAIMGTEEKITRIRGTVTSYRGRTLLPTYHPSFLLRNQGAMKDAYEDMDKLKALLGQPANEARARPGLR
jgi:uracil-DNA glycosylase